MDGYAAAGAAAVLENSVGEGTDLLKGEGGPLREEADPSFGDVALQTEGARHTLVFGPGSNGHGLRGTHADDMVAAIVDG